MWHGLLRLWHGLPTVPPARPIGLPESRNSHQFLQRPHAAVHQMLRPAGQIVHRRHVRVDPQAVIDGRMHFAKRNRPVLDIRCVFVGRADDLARAETAASQEAQFTAGQ